jgi:hypothetical protein
MVEWLARCYEIMYEAAIFMSEDEAVHLQFAIGRFLMHYTWLTEYSCSHGLLYFNILPKHHYFVHVGFQAVVINPRYTHNYKEESFIGRLTTLYKSCAHGRYRGTVQRTALRKYVVGLSVLLSDLEQGV